MNLFDLIHTEQPSKEIAQTKQGGWAGSVDVGDVVNINNESFRVVGPPQYDTKMLCGETENGYFLIEPDGSRSYYDMQDKPHRDDGPAAISSGDLYWYKHGERHREDGPAVTQSNGTEMWYRDGDLHREDGPAITRADGSTAWYRHGERHREDGPAMIYSNGTEMWYYDGELHREDGPAITRADGTKEYWLYDKRVTKEDLP